MITFDEIPNQEQYVGVFVTIGEGHFFARKAFFAKWDSMDYIILEDPFWVGTFFNEEHGISFPYYIKQLETMWIHQSDIKRIYQTRKEPSHLQRTQDEAYEEIFSALREKNTAKKKAWYKKIKHFIVSAKEG